MHETLFVASFIGMPSMHHYWGSSEHVHVYSNETTKRLGNAAELGVELVSESVLQGQKI